MNAGKVIRSTTFGGDRPLICPPLVGRTAKRAQARRAGVAETESLRVH
jgi:hypothetical protein